METKITENQRKYMARRVNEEFDQAVSFIKQQEAVKISKISKKAETQYKKTLGISKQVIAFHKAEKALEKARKECQEIVSAMESHNPSDDKVKKQHLSHYYGPDINIHNAKDMDQYVSMRCIHLALTNFGKTPEGEEMAKLEKKRKEAVDYIYGITKSNGIAVGLSKVLKGTNIKLKLGE
tara:strand:+ start:2062 stop:2601 length:540 start_codon:yes stop_codon:yes gene_type:complete